MQLSKFKEGLLKTRTSITMRLTKILRRGGHLDEAVLDQIEGILIEADAGVDSAFYLVEALRRRVGTDGTADGNHVKTLLKEEILKILETPLPSQIPRVPEHDGPRVILIVGVNGVGKTTAVGKLAARYTGVHLEVVLAACDTFRAAAIDQLAIWADRSQAHLVRHQTGADPASVAFDALSAARARGADFLIVDTAGRLHTKVHLMEELKKIHRVIQKSQPGSPHETLLVLDAATGQNGFIQAREFHAALGLTGVILTKLDGTAKGGIVIAISQLLGLPVRWVSMGEGIDDLQDFDPKVFVDAMFDE